MPNITELSRDAARSMSPKEREGWSTEPKRRKRKEKAIPASKSDDIDDKMAFLKEQPQVSLLDLRKDIGEYFGQAHFNKKSFVVTKNGTMVGAIVSLDDLIELNILRALHKKKP